MTDIDVAGLRAAAEGATPGEWVTEHDEYGDEWWFGGTNDGGQVTVGKLGGTHHIVTDAGHAADMAHIAAANPAVVLALLDRLAVAEGAVDRVRAVAEAGDVRTLDDSEEPCVMLDDLRAAIDNEENR